MSSFHSECIFPNMYHLRGWTALNDSIMGGSSYSECYLTPEGIRLEGFLIEEGGGFVSCRSPLFNPTLDLSKYKGIQLNIDGKGLTLKFAIACMDGMFGLTDFLSGGLRWISEFSTETSGTTSHNIYFDDLEASVRAKPVSFPVSFSSSKITQFQLLYSKFGKPGKLNPKFQPGKINIILRSIYGLF